MVSWWNMVCRKDTKYKSDRNKIIQKMGSPNLECFCEYWPSTQRTNFTAFVKENSNIDHVIHLENLEEEFNALPFVDKQITIPVKNKREHMPWEEALTPSAVASINRWYADDFKLGGYEML
jgi:hypothetical protein